jgi:PAS domain S-box-containing protein
MAHQLEGYDPARAPRHVPGQKHPTGPPPCGKGSAEERIDERGAETAAKLRATLANAPVHVFAIDGEGKFTLSAGRGPPAFGFSAEQLVGRSALDLYRDVTTTDTHGRSTSGADAVRRALGGSEFVGLCTMGEAVLDLRLLPQIDAASARVVGVVGVATDVTGHARAEATLREARDRLVVADRLAAIGTLAAGAAHEINNPLTYALMNVAHVLRQLRARSASDAIDGGDPGVERLPRLIGWLAQAEEGIGRVRDVVRNLLTFSHGNVEKRVLLDVRGILESSIQMALHEIVHRARLVRDLGELPPVSANEAALGQVFLNLLVNAAQAIPEGDGRDHEVRVRASTDQDGNAVVEVADTGVGIPAEILPRIFEAFFTTRAVGGGTGLGLSISHGTVTSLGGVIDVSSEVGRGTCFRIILPPAEGWRRPMAPGVFAVRPVGRRSVLVVDDDVRVGEALARELDAEADVEVMTDGAAVVARLAAGERWDVILCDLMMPGLSGMAVYAEALRCAPDAASRMLFTTAGAFTPRAREFVKGFADRCFDKPIRAEQLREIVRGSSR